jgi:hypothetical protein
MQTLSILQQACIGAMALQSFALATVANTWDVFPTSFHMGGNEDGRGLGERLAIDSHLTSTLYFGSRHDGLQRTSLAEPTLFVSTDGGATFASTGTTGLPVGIRDDRPNSSERPLPLIATMGKVGGSVVRLGERTISL